MFACRTGRATSPTSSWSNLAVARTYGAACAGAPTEVPRKCARHDLSSARINRPCSHSDLMNKFLDQISLCTFSTGQAMVREVLDDWLQFLGGRPNQVIFAVSPIDEPPPVYGELRGEGMIDRILLLGTKGSSVMQVDSEAIRLIVAAATTEWVLLIKLDTLPYRSGHETWLDDAMELVEKYHLFGMTGGFPIADLVPLEDGYSTTQKYSNNFSIFRRSEWLSVIRASVDNASDQAAAKGLQLHGDKIRYLNEYMLETHLENTGRRMLVKHDTRHWSIFHVNVWGEALRSVRTAYIKRQGIKRFFNTGKPLRRSLRYSWQKYYGYPRPSFLRLMRIVLGRWRRSLFGIRS